MTGLERYRALERRWLAARAAACGELADSVEAAFMAELDDIWWSLLDAEQQTIDAEHRSAAELPIAKGETESRREHSAPSTIPTHDPPDGAAAGRERTQPALPGSARHRTSTLGGVCN